MFRDWLMGEMPLRELAGPASRGRLSRVAWLVHHRQCLLNALPALRGKNLACWCKPRDPCHGDVLLEIANAGRDRAKADSRGTYRNASP
jgi:hypothetical protein